MPLTTVTRVRPLRRRRLRASTPSSPRPSCAAPGAPRTLHRRAGGLLGVRARHPAAAAPMRDDGHLPRLSARLGYLSRTNSESILGAIAPDDARSTTAAASRSPRRSTPTSTPTSSRSATARAATAMSLLQTVLTDGDGPEPRWQTWLKEMWAEAPNVARPLRLQALVGAHRDRAGDADARQLDHHVHRRGSRARAWRLTSRQGHGAPNPTWIPVANKAVRKMAEHHGRHPGRLDRRAVQPAADRALHRRLHDRRLARDRGRRRLPARLRPPRPARRRRLGDLGQPRRQPVADDHRPGRAGDGALAQQGRARPAPGSARRTSGSPRWRRRRRRFPSGAPARCGCRSSRVADRDREQLSRSFRQLRNPASTDSFTVQGCIAPSRGPSSTRFIPTWSIRAQPPSSPAGP